MGALNIKDLKVAEKARRLAKLRGQSITAAVSDAIDELLGREERKRAIGDEERERRVDQIVREFNEKIKKDAPTLDEIMDEMYDEHGLPK